MGYIVMCGPKGYGFSAVLVIDRVSILANFDHSLAYAKHPRVASSPPSLACVAAVSFPFPNAREREENCERVRK